MKFLCTTVTSKRFCVPFTFFFPLSSKFRKCRSSIPLPPCSSPDSSWISLCASRRPFVLSRGRVSCEFKYIFDPLFCLGVSKHFQKRYSCRKSEANFDQRRHWHCCAGAASRNVPAIALFKMHVYRIFQRSVAWGDSRGTTPGFKLVLCRLVSLPYWLWLGEKLERCKGFGMSKPFSFEPLESFRRNFKSKSHHVKGNGHY